jgi:hypothetical protein
MTPRVNITNAQQRVSVNVNEAGEVNVVVQQGNVTIDGGVGTVTSVSATGSDGITVGGSPITSSGTLTLGVDSATMKTTLDLAGTNTGDQNLFSTIAVSGQIDVVADTTSDTLTLVAGSNITITTDAATDSVTISAPSVAALTQVIRTDASQSLTKSQKLRAAINSGCLISFDREIVGQGSSSITSFSELWFTSLPKQFAILDLSLMLFGVSGPIGDASYLWSLGTPSNPIISDASAVLVSQLNTLADYSSSLASSAELPAQTPIVFSIDLNNLNSVPGVEILGLRVFMRGVWLT